MAALPISERELRILQGGFVILVVFGISVSLVNGGGVLASVVGGATLGGLAFLPPAMLYALYLYGKRQPA